MNTDHESMEANQVVQGYLRVAKMVADGNNFEQAELVYKSAVSIAERKTGDKSASTGYALLELWYFYEKTGQDARAAFIWDRLSTLIVENCQRLSLIEEA